MTPVRVVLVATLGALLAMILAPPASAASVTATIDGVTYAADDADVAAGATVTAYDGTTQGSAVVIPATVMIAGTAYSVTTIGPSAFSRKNLTDITLPGSIATIQTRAFEHNQLSFVTLPRQLKEVGDYAFFNNGIESVNMPDAITSIGSHAFANNNLLFLEIRGPITTIGAYAFESNGIETLNLPGSLTTIGTGAFSRNSLTSITLPESVTVIESSAFFSNDLTGVTFPDALTTVGDSAFGANEIEQITIPASVTYIGANAFYNNPTLEEVTFEGDAPSVGSSPFGSTGAPDGALITSYARNDGFTVPTWNAGGVDYRSRSIATVTFDPVNGDGTTSVEAEVGQTVSEPPAPEREGFTFSGWSTAQGPYDFTLPVAGDLTLTAQWVAVPELTAPPTATAGAAVTISGMGFGPSTPVVIELHSEPVRLGATTTDANGAFSITVTIPADTSTGRHELVAIADGATVATTTITVSAPSIDPTEELAATGVDTRGLAVAALLALGGIAVVVAARRATL